MSIPLTKITWNKGTTTKAFHNKILSQRLPLYTCVRGAKNVLPAAEYESASGFNHVARQLLKKPNK